MPGGGGLKPALLQLPDGSQKLVFKREKPQSTSSSALSSSSTSTAAAAAAIEGFAAATLAHTYVELGPIMHDERNTSLMELSVTIGGVNYATLLCYMFHANCSLCRSAELQPRGRKLRGEGGDGAGAGQSAGVAWCARRLVTLQLQRAIPPTFVMF